MRTVFTLFLLFLLIHGYSQEMVGTAYKLSGLECNIVSSFSTDPNAAIGLDNEGGDLWVSFSSIYEFIFKMDTLGNILDTITLPFLGSGINYDDIEVSGHTLWTVPESPAKMFAVNLNSESVTEIALPAFGMEPYHYFSVAFDGQFLWVLNYQTPTFETRLYKMDTSTYTVIDSVDLSHPVVTIEMINNELWGYCVAQCFPYMMFRINTATGTFTDSSEWCVTGSPYGMAWDGNYLWQTAGFDRMIHKVDIGLNIGIPQTQDAGQTVSLYPNPAASRVEISSAGIKGTLIVRNIYGTEVYRTTMEGENISLALDHYSSGIYSAHLYPEGDKATRVTRFVVER